MGCVDNQIGRPCNSLNRTPTNGASFVNPAPRSYPFWVAATHFFNHQTHHRGQLTTLLMQAGVDPGVTDLIWLPELVRPGGS